MTTLHKIAYPDSNIDWEIIKYFIIDTYNNGYPVTTQMIYLEILKQMPLGKYKKYTIYQRIYRFLKRNNFLFVMKHI